MKKIILYYEKEFIADGEHITHISGGLKFYNQLLIDSQILLNSGLSPFMKLDHFFNISKVSYELKNISDFIDQSEILSIITIKIFPGFKEYISEYGLEGMLLPKTLKLLQQRKITLVIQGAGESCDLYEIVTLKPSDL